MSEKMKRLPSKAKIVKADGTVTSTNAAVNASNAVRNHPGEYYKIVCRYKRNRFRQSVNSEGQIVWKEVDEAEKNMLPPFIVPRNLIERGKERFWGSIWCAEMNEKLQKAEKNNALMIISMDKLVNDKDADGGITEEKEQIEKTIMDA